MTLSKIEEAKEVGIKWLCPELKKDELINHVLDKSLNHLKDSYEKDIDALNKEIKNKRKTEKFRFIKR